MPTLSGKSSSNSNDSQTMFGYLNTAGNCKTKHHYALTKNLKILCIPYTSILNMEISTRKSLFFLVAVKLVHFKKAPVVYSVACQILCITTLFIHEKNFVSSFQMAKQVTSSGCGKRSWWTRTVCEDCVLSFRTNVLYSFLSCSSASPFTTAINGCSSQRLIYCSKWANKSNMS